MNKESNKLVARLITDQTFRDWCVGDASEEENRRWERWISKHVDHIEDIIAAKNIVLELEQIQQKSPLTGDRKNKSWKKLNRRIIVSNEPQKSSSALHVSSRSHFGWMLTAAASLMLLLTSYVAIEYTNILSIPADEKAVVPEPEVLTTSTDYGQQKVITLDSGTRITLNANSSVTYYEGWVYEDTVRIELKGEALFDVTSRKLDQGPVFQVNTADGRVHVLGTRFVVNTWDQGTKVVLEKGKVAIEQQRETMDNNKAVLNANELAEFSNSEAEISIRNVNSDIYTSWTDGLLVFEETPLTEVADRIEKLFGKRVQIADRQLLNRKVSGAVENEVLEVLLSALSSTLQITVEQQADTITFSEDAKEDSFKTNTK